MVVFHPNVGASFVGGLSIALDLVIFAFARMTRFAFEPKPSGSSLTGGAAKNIRIMRKS